LGIKGYYRCLLLSKILKIKQSENFFTNFSQREGKNSQKKKVKEMAMAKIPQTIPL